jgi:alpha,alpha-trehalase
VEWLCLPRGDSPSVFATLLDRSAGFFRFGPAHSRVPAHRRYLPGSMVLETTWSTATGWMVVTDALVMGQWDGSERIEGMRRPPDDYASRGKLTSDGLVLRYRPAETDDGLSGD